MLHIMSARSFFNSPLFLIALVLGMVPYLWIAFFSFPSADDFCATLLSDQASDAFQNAANLYSGSNGRYAVNFLLWFSPLREASLTGYQLWAFGLLLLSLFSLHRLLAVFPGGGRDTLWVRLAANFGWHLVFLSGMPDLAEGVYWQAGATAYLGGQALLFLHLSFFFRAHQQTSFLHTAGLFLTLILAMGFYEVQTVGLALFYAITLAWKLATGRKSGLWFYGLTFFSIALAVIVYLAPGNAVRAAHYPDSGRLLYSVAMSFLQTLRFLGEWLAYAPLWTGIGLCLVVPAKLPQLPFRLPAKRALLIGGLIVFLSAFIPYYTTGTLGQHRTINAAYGAFLLLALVWAFSLRQRFGEHPYMAPLHTYKARVMMSAFFISAVCFTGNGYLVSSDLLQGRASAYLEAQQHREAEILTHLEDEAYLIQPLQSWAGSIASFDVPPADHGKIGECMLLYYGAYRQSLR